MSDSILSSLVKRGGWPQGKEDRRTVEQGDEIDKFTPIIAEGLKEVNEITIFLTQLYGEVHMLWGGEKCGSI